MEFFHSPITYLVILCNVIMSIKGFQDSLFIEKNLFKPRRIIDYQEYGRVIYSGFIHANWPHLFFNMYSLYSFGPILEQYYGTLFFSSVYFGSLLGGGLLSLIIHKNNSQYAALGASGAVNGIIFTGIVLFPDLEIGMFFIPIGIPGWIFGVLYTLYSIYGVQAKKDNIGHEAHLGGAIFGILVTLAFYPFLLKEHLSVVLMILTPSLIFFYLMVFKPQLLNLDVPTRKRKKIIVDDHYNSIRAEKQKEVDRILEKINENGVESLDDYEKRFLDMNK